MFSKTREQIKWKIVERAQIPRRGGVMTHSERNPIEEALDKLGPPSKMLEQLNKDALSIDSLITREISDISHVKTSEDQFSA
jgi:hypothetical protein